MKLLPLSVVMPVYNGEKYLEEAINSVLAQTFTNYELLIIDDGSTDSSIKIIQSIKDSRIRLIKNEKNRGVAFTRNVGLSEAKGEFLAWMDCDDLIERDRLEIQINYLRNNVDAGICGTGLKRFGEGRARVTKQFLEPEMIKASLLFTPSIRPATAMYRLSMIRDANLTFDITLAVAEDYDFLFESSFHFPLRNLEQVLYHYRASETSLMKKYSEQEQLLFDLHKVIYAKAFDKLEVQHTDKNFKLHYSCASTQLIFNFQELTEIYDWLLYLKKKNSKVKLYNENAFDKVLASVFFFISKKTSQIGPQIFFFYLKNRKSFSTNESFSEIKLLLRCLMFYKKF